MTFSTTLTETKTFTLTHARYLASKVVTDLKRMQRLYGSPSDALIDFFDKELTALLQGGYLKSVMYGYKRGDQFIEPTLIYTADALTSSTADDDPGKIKPGKDTSGAYFYSFLQYSSAWFQLSPAEQSAFESKLPRQRSVGSEPGYSGYLENDLNYSSGGRALARKQVRSA